MFLEIIFKICEFFFGAVGMGGLNVYFLIDFQAFLYSGNRISLIDKQK